MPRKKAKSIVPVDQQKSSAAQFLTYVASTGAGGEKYEIRYEDENIWMSQKMLAEVYGIEVNSVNYHIKKLFQDSELDSRMKIATNSEVYRGRMRFDSTCDILPFRDR